MVKFHVDLAKESLLKSRLRMLGMALKKLYRNTLNGCIYSTGNYHDSLSDAKAATELQPTFLKAIVRGKYVCCLVSENVITLCIMND